jgi:phosphatidate cytidylyltransferase
MFKTRALTVVVLLPVFAAALLFLPRALWALFLLPVLAIGSWEWAGLARYPSARRVVYSAILVTSALALFYVAPIFFDASDVDAAVFAFSCVFWFAAVPFWLGTRWVAPNALTLGVAGWIALVPMWLALVRMQAAPWALLGFLGVVWIADTAAYLAGKQWGKHKLAPRISPGKTWEGALGAAAAVVLYYGVLVLSVPASARYFDGVRGLFIFLAVLALSVEGDLFESLLKRQAGVKDSGHLLPGHGGMLDRIDGLTATMPAAALAYYLH